MKEFDTNKHSKQPKGRSQANLESHHIESQTRLKQQTANYSAGKARTILLDKQRHEALTKQQLADMADPGHDKRLGTSGAVKRGAQLLTNQNVPEPIANKIALEHDANLKGTTPLDKVPAAVGKYYGTRQIKEHARQLKKAGASEGEAGQRALERDGNRRAATPLDKVRSEIEKQTAQSPTQKQGNAATARMFKRGASSAAKAEWSEGGASKTSSAAKTAASDSSQRQVNPGASGHKSSNATGDMFKRGASSIAKAEWSTREASKTTRLSKAAASSGQQRAANSGKSGYSTKSGSAASQRHSSSGKSAGTKAGAGAAASARAPGAGKAASNPIAPAAPSPAPTVKSPFGTPPSKI